MTATRQIHLVRRPKGMPVLEDFALVEAQVGEPAEGENGAEDRLLSHEDHLRG